MATAWAETTRREAEPWHASTVNFDRLRGRDVEAFRLGLPSPHDPNDPAIAGSRAFANASHYDAQVLAWSNEIASCYARPDEILARPGALERVIEVAMANPPWEAPGPDRAQLEELVA